MKIKQAVIYGILIWILIYVLSTIYNNIFITYLHNYNIILPLILIVVTGFFGILYIRNIETNEVVEGFLVGIVFIIVDIILDLSIFIIPNNINPLTVNYPLHLISTIITTLLITTFLGYLAQMSIELK